MAEHPFNPAALRTQTASSEIETVNFSLNSAVTFTTLKHGFFRNFLITHLLSCLIGFINQPRAGLSLAKALST